MGLLEFDKLPVNTLVGADIDTFKKICAGRTVEKPYLKKYRLTKAISGLLSTLAPIQERRYQKLLADKPLENPPLFILGHWRSGTTFVHNVLCKDDHFGYNITYQTVFPHLMMWGQPFFKKTVKWLMPDKRPHDNMELDPDLPQEEEFAVGSMMPYSYYNFWFFPKYLDEYCDKYLLFDEITDEEKEIFRETLIKVVKISLWNTGGTQFLSKNPPHTARIKFLLETFPDAKFIYLMRNPYTVFESTRSFFMNALQPLKLQDVTREYMEEKILEVYTKMYRKYESEKSLIPAGNLIEVKFEDFEADSIGLTERIYDELNLPGYDLAEMNIRRYLESKKGFRKNKYKYDDRTVELVEKHWDYVIKDWGYTL
ncbi:MAG: sulfotransferase [Rikenellaceae bacterium]|nr:sulfotransferase [Rikenellaceae bacterium]